MDFRGTYEFTLDDRGRVSIPARYRHELERAILTMGEDGCVEVYTEDGHANTSRHFTVEPPTTPEGRQARRKFYGESFDIELDRQGRILIPASLRQRAALNGRVIISGRKECLEIWNPERLAAVTGNPAAASSAAVGPGD